MTRTDLPPAPACPAGWCTELWAYSWRVAAGEALLLADIAPELCITEEAVAAEARAVYGEEAARRAVAN
jgi:hypothetical protein